MKVAQVTTSSKGGAGIAALRLHKALQQAGIQSAYISTDKTLNFDDDEIEDPFFSYHRPSFFKKIIFKLQKLVNPTKEQQLKRKFASLTPKMDYEIVTLPFSSYPLASHPLLVEADIINLHWVGQLLNYDQFFTAVNKPIVWTLHDMNPFKGLFHYEGDEQKNSVASGLNTEVVALKRQAILKIERAVILSPSKWLLKAAVDSGAFDHFQQKKCIPNGIDLNVFNRSGREAARQRLGIKDDENVLLFTAGNLDNHRKGMDLMLGALEKLRLPVTLLTLGKGDIETSNKEVKIIPLGFVSNANEIATYYQVADAFVMPSREDNLPNTMLESFAVGTPVISFPIGGAIEHITNGFNGVLAEEISSASLARAILEFFENREAYKEELIRKYAEDNFSSERQAEAYVAVYKNLLK